MLKLLSTAQLNQLQKLFVVMILLDWLALEHSKRLTEKPEKEGIPKQAYK